VAALFFLHMSSTHSMNIQKDQNTVAQNVSDEEPLCAVCSRCDPRACWTWTGWGASYCSSYVLGGFLYGFGKMSAGVALGGMPCVFSLLGCAVGYTAHRCQYGDPQQKPLLNMPPQVQENDEW
jgi:hypothetical protein